MAHWKWLRQGLGPPGFPASSRVPVLMVACEEQRCGARLPSNPRGLATTCEAKQGWKPGRAQVWMAPQTLSLVPATILVSGSRVQQRVARGQVPHP